MRLDRIYVDAAAKPLALHAHRTPLSAVASDHLPLVLRFKAPTTEAPRPHSAPVELIG